MNLSKKQLAEAWGRVERELRAATVHIDRLESRLELLEKEHGATSHLLHLQAGVSKSGGEPGPSEWDEAWDQALAAHRAVESAERGEEG